MFRIKAQRVVHFTEKHSSVIVTVQDKNWTVNLKLSAESENYESAKAVMNTLLMQVDSIQEEINGEARGTEASGSEPSSGAV